jgi:hypothetical protein
MHIQIEASYGPCLYGSINRTIPKVHMSHFSTASPNDRVSELSNALAR